MKSLLKILIPTVGFLFTSNIDSKAQYSALDDYFSKIPTEQVPEKYRSYQKDGADTIEQIFYPGIETNFDTLKLTALDIDGDSLADVIEIEGIIFNPDFKKTPRPLGYHFYDETQENNYKTYVDIYLDGINGNEISKETFDKFMKRQREMRRRIPNFNSRRKVDI